MARQLRIEYEGAFYHITSRGNQRGQIFWDKQDRHQFIEILKRTKDRYGYFLHAYVLMDNHYHLLIETPHANIKQIMQNINTSYTVYVNRRHRRHGHLFQGRYKSFIVDKEKYLVELARYIHLNPVRAGLVERADDYNWSSYKEYINVKGKYRIADTDDTLYLFSKMRSEAIKRYSEFVSAGATKESPLQEAVGSVLGSETFTEKVLSYLKGKPDRQEISDLKKIEPKHKVGNVISAVAVFYGLKDYEIKERKRKTASQRKVAIYLSKILSGKKNGEIGKEFNITAQAIANAVNDIEKKKKKNKKFTKEIITIIGIIKS